MRDPNDGPRGVEVKIGFYSCMSGMPWGGSEVLWQRAAKWLQLYGHPITVNYKWWPRKAMPLEHLEERGAKIWYRDQPKSKSQLRKEKWLRWFRRSPPLQTWLESERPDVVLITLGYHSDPLPIADECQRLGIPYGINLQCASHFFFIPGDRMEEYRNWYTNAKRVFFVSEENEAKMQNNLAMKFEQGEIIANPFNVPYDAVPTWPETNGVYRMAVVGRLHFQSKGQDLIVDVMKQPKWRERKLQIRFYGHDQGNHKQLKELIRLHGLESQLVYEGFHQNVEQIWQENHALLLPSRYEGAPLAFIEAMLCHRIAITTDIGRNRELMEDNRSGFLALAPSVELIDEAMERAWQKRNHWQSMGVLAGQQIRSKYPQDPVRDYAEKILQLGESTTTKGSNAAFA
jgi:glycosyltransferase involved in cell wall biosynthesis